MARRNIPEDHTSQEEYTGPPMFLRSLIGVATVAIFWSIGNNYLESQVIFANVSGSSMEYQLLDGEHVMVDKIDAPKLERGNIVSIRANEEDPLNPRIAEATANKEDIKYVKRIVGLPGETIEGREDGIYINGEKIDEPYLANKYKPVPIPWTLDSLSNGSIWADGKGHTVIPEDHVFVLGDNREVSEDSRYFGFVHKDNIDGNVKTFPWNDGPVIDQKGSE